MVVCALAADISYHEPGVEFTRPSHTNSADMGADAFLLHPLGFLEDRLLPIAQGTNSSLLPSAMENPNTLESRITSGKSEKTRLDVKATPNRLTTPTVDKFIADVHKHPDCSGHLLVGGSGLSGRAKKKLDQARQDFREHGKVLAHIDNDGVRRISGSFPPAPRNLESSFSQEES